MTLGMTHTLGSVYVIQPTLGMLWLIVTRESYDALLIRLYCVTLHSMSPLALLTPSISFFRSLE
jgi:hypothetical protein